MGTWNKLWSEGLLKMKILWYAFIKACVDCNWDALDIFMLPVEFDQR